MAIETKPLIQEEAYALSAAIAIVAVWSVTIGVFWIHGRLRRTPARAPVLTTVQALCGLICVMNLAFFEFVPNRPCVARLWLLTMGFYWWCTTLLLRSAILFVTSRFNQLKLLGEVVPNISKSRRGRKRHAGSSSAASDAPTSDGEGSWISAADVSTMDDGGSTSPGGSDAEKHASPAVRTDLPTISSVSACEVVEPVEGEGEEEPATKEKEAGHFTSIFLPYIKAVVDIHRTRSKGLVLNMECFTEILEDESLFRSFKQFAAEDLTVENAIFLEAYKASELMTIYEKGMQKAKRKETRRSSRMLGSFLANISRTSQTGSFHSDGKHLLPSPVTEEPSPTSSPTDPDAKLLPLPAVDAALMSSPLRMPRSVRGHYNSFYAHYVREGSLFEVNLSGRTREKLKAMHRSGEWTRDAFAEARQEVIMSLPRKQRPLERSIPEGQEDKVHASFVRASIEHSCINGDGTVHLEHPPHPPNRLRETMASPSPSPSPVPTATSSTGANSAAAALAASSASQSIAASAAGGLGHKVYIGLAPLVNPGWLTYLPAPSNIPYHPGSYAFVLILWDDVSVSYEIQLGTNLEGQNKPFERHIVSHPGNPTDTPEERLRDWVAAHPLHELQEVGTTLKSLDDADKFLKTWRKKSLKYFIFWDNNSSFVDALCAEMINGTASWKVSFAMPGAGKIDFNHVAPFDTPLGYAVWRKNHASESYWGLLSHRPDAATTSTLVPLSTPKRTPSLTTSYSFGFDADGRVNIDLHGDVDVTLDDDADSTGAKTDSTAVVAPSPPSMAAAAATLTRHSDSTTSLPAELDPYKSVPAMSIVILIVGSRGDVQPFIALGKELKKYGHRVRLATHGIFRQFVTENGLEFYPLAGDPSELMAYMVKNPGLLPSIESVRAGDIGKKRRMIEAILDSTYKACVSADPEDPEKTPFVCHAIISNPPAFGHIHCAQRLFVPCHIFFTMPWSPTKAFPHPLVNVNYTKSSRPITNLFSYELVEFMTWEGLGDIINNFRKNSLGLPKIPSMVAPTMLKNLEVPHTYTWSEALIPKPADWGPHIDLASNYTPPADLVEFLNAGPPPVYIGFGSIVVDDPDGLTQMIFEAVEKAGVRALVSKGWGGLGGEQLKVPSSIYLIGNCPHDWLFQHVSAVVHHGGAGTTAAGLKAGKPTIIVPFFGDQPFWGAMIASIGAGPPPIHNKKLTADRLAAALKHALRPETTEAAQKAAEQIRSESGVAEGARSFHRHLPLDAMRCDVDPSRIAVWFVPHLNIKISRYVADEAVKAGKIRSDQLLVYRYCQWEPENARGSSFMFDKDEEHGAHGPGISPPGTPHMSPGNLTPQTSTGSLNVPAQPQAAGAAPPSPGVRKSRSKIFSAITDNVVSGAKVIQGKITSLTATSMYTTAHVGGKTVQKGFDTVKVGLDVGNKTVQKGLDLGNKTVQKGLETVKSGLDVVQRSMDNVILAERGRHLNTGAGDACNRSPSPGYPAAQEPSTLPRSTSPLPGQNATPSPATLPRGRVFGGRRRAKRFGRRQQQEQQANQAGAPVHAYSTPLPAIEVPDHSVAAPHPISLAEHLLNSDEVESPHEVVVLEHVANLEIHDDHDHDHDEHEHEHEVPPSQAPHVEAGVPEAAPKRGRKLFGLMGRERVLKRFDTVSSAYSKHADETEDVPGATVYVSRPGGFRATH
ncbi:hypothetical protein HDU96_000040 [Phlyctochytrium bullatum]|nr:hypothetical protein HDU96_000040 [Phlyctochytrium bullatum]